MKHNSEIDRILGLLHERRLLTALDALAGYLAAHPRQKGSDALESVRDDYARMRRYWSEGYRDPHMERIYTELLQRLYVLTSNVGINWQLGESPFLKALYHRPRDRRNDWSISAVRAEMEAYVSEVTLLQLEPEHTRRQKSEPLHKEHSEHMRDLFDYILTSKLWREATADGFIDMLLSPTLYTHDQQLVESAIFLSAYHHFCPQKFRVLAEVYMKATDERLRQYALVGWALLLTRADVDVFPELGSLTARMLDDERTRSELAELQMQLVYCLEADADAKTIASEIMPDIVKGGRSQLNDLNLSLTDESSLEDIIHPEASERDMERLEQSVHRMVDMQKRGADIYFGGFSQMKRYPFFNEVSNWFVPFYTQHPDISRIWSNSKGKKLLKMITSVGAFCDSDKYSFVLTFDRVLDQLPANLSALGDDALAPVGGMVGEKEQEQPAFIRRAYLQNIYRFCRLFSYRREFDDIFQEDGPQSGLLFFATPILQSRLLASGAVAVANFLMKHRRYKDVVGVLKNMHGMRDNDQACLMMGTALMRTETGDGLAPEEFFDLVLARDSFNERALSASARLLFADQQYEQALGHYETLMTLRSDQRSYQLNAAICFIHLGRQQEALKLLFKLSYDNAGDVEVTRALAWALTVDGRCEQAREYYQRLLSAGDAHPVDLLNSGYNEWLAGRNADAVGMFRRFVALQEHQATALEKEFMLKEHKLLSGRGISDTEIRLMLDEVLSVG